MTRRLGEHLHDVRRTQRRSLKSVAEAARISVAYLQKLERGEVRSPSPHVLHGLSAALRVSYAALMEQAGFVVPERAVGSTPERVREAVAEVRRQQPNLPDLLEIYRERRRQYAAARPASTPAREAQDAIRAARPRYRV